MRRALPIAFFLTVAACYGQRHGTYGGTVSSIPYSPSFGTGRNVPFPARGTGSHGYRAAAYPVFIGGFGFGFYGDAPPDAESAPAPPVVINQYFGAPPDAPDVVQQPEQQPDQPSSTGEAPPEPRTYLIAYRDHSVYTALAYWIEDQTLHYVTPSNTHNQADLSLIDVDFTKKLNTDRNMPFSVPH